MELYHLPPGTILFHGTAWDISMDDIFTELDPQQSDWGVIWLADNVDVAEWFASQASAGEPTYMQVVMKVKLTKPHVFIEAYKSQYLYQGEYMSGDELISELGYGDPRDIYTLLKKRYPQFDGATAQASAGDPGRTVYRDLAFFHATGFTIVGYKYYSYKREQWSSYMDEAAIIKVYMDAKQKYQASLK